MSSAKDSRPSSLAASSSGASGTAAETAADRAADKAADNARRGEKALREFHDEEDLKRVYDLRMIIRLWPYVRPYRRYMVGSVVLLVIMAAFGLLRPLVMREALSTFQEPGGAAQLTKLGFVLAGLIVLEQGLAFPQMYWMQIAGAKGMAGLRNKVFSFLHTRSLAFFDRTPIGRLVTRVTNDVDSMGEMFASGALNAIGDLIRLIAIVGILLSLNWKMSLFAFAVLPPVAFGVNWTRKRMRTVYRQVRSKTARLNAFINEQVSGISVVQAYARERKSQEAFDEINYAYRAANTQAIVLDATLDASIEMVSSLSIAAILWYAGGQALSSDIDFPTLFAFVAYIDMFFMPVRNLSARYTQIQSALAGAERVFQLLESNNTEDAAAEAESTAEFITRAPQTEGWPATDGPAFAFKDVSFSYKPGVMVLRDIELEAHRGETIAIVGPTGSGKSTIASLLLRLYDATDGVVEVLGGDVKSVDRTTLRQQFAVVPQDVFLFPGTVASNIAAGENKPDRGRIRSTLKSIGGLALVEGREGGLDAEVQERGSNFSAGERQMIAFARALYRDPQLLILDEPTASIDSDTEVQLQRAMDAAMEGRTALIIAHRLSTIRNADRIVVLHQGAISEQGSHQELLDLGGVYAKLHKLQVARKAIEEKVGKLVDG